MRMRALVAVVAMCLVAGSMGLAAAPPKPQKTPKPATHTLSGTVESYDAAARTLTVKGTKATWTFGVGDARVWDGSKSVGIEDLASHMGTKVTVKYTETAGDKSATSVRLAASRPKSR